MIQVKWITETNLASVFSINKTAMGHKCLERPLQLQFPNISVIPSSDCLARLLWRKQIHRIYTSLNIMTMDLLAVEDNQCLTHIHVFTLVPVLVVKQTFFSSQTDKGQHVTFHWQI